VEKSLNNIGLGPRILGLAAVPLLISIIFAAVAAFDSLNVANQAGKLDRLASHAPFVSDIVHELQKERGLSAGFIGSRGDGTHKRHLLAQRKETDKAVAAFRRADKGFDYVVYSKRFLEIANTAKAELGKLEKERRKIDNLDGSLADMLGFYSGTIEEFLAIIEDAAVLSTDAAITRKITAYIGLLEAKERAGQERAYGNGGFASGLFSKEAFVSFAELVSAQDSFLSIHHMFATAEGRAFYDKTMRGKAIQNVQAMRDFVFSSRGEVRSGEYDSSFWFAEMSKKIDLLKKVEDFSNAEILVVTGSMASSARNTFWILTVSVLVGTGVIFFLSFMIYHSVARPLRGIEGAMRQLADGDLEAHIPFIDYGSSIGQMANAVYAFKQNGIEAVRLAEEAKVAEAEQASRDTKQREEAQLREQQERAREAEDNARREKRAEAIEKLTRQFDSQVASSMQSLNTAITDVAQMATHMNGQADTTASESNSASSAAEQTNSNMQTVASATEELAASISEISRQVSQSSQISETAVSEAGNAAAAVGKLEETSRKIGDVVDLINDIAEQTNLLALNATIEAARAGDAGKGFAVVAHEVKALASQTAQATSDIASQVDNMRGVSNNVSEAVKKISGVISETSQISASVAGAVEEQGAATNEISRNVQEANRGTMQLSGNIRVVMEGATGTKTAAGNLQNSSDDLASHGTELKALIDTFLTDVKAV
jgi:methyl-accepting chemotaxis protein